jgi:hypothetical protein
MDIVGAEAAGLRVDRVIQQRAGRDRTQLEQGFVTRH